MITKGRILSSEKDFTQDCDTVVAGKRETYMGESDGNGSLHRTRKSNITVDVRQTAAAVGLRGARVGNANPLLRTLS